MSYTCRYDTIHSYSVELHAHSMTTCTSALIDQDLIPECIQIKKKTEFYPGFKILGEATGDNVTIGGGCKRGVCPFPHEHTRLDITEL